MFPLFIVLLEFFSLAVIIFVILDSGQYFENDLILTKTCSIITAIAGALDVENSFNDVNNAGEVSVGKD